MPSGILFTPAPDVVRVLHALLDRLEARPAGEPTEQVGETHRSRPARLRLADLQLPGYFSQEDPLPRLVTNQQLLDLEKQGWLNLKWLPGETGHLLESVALWPAAARPVFDLLGRIPCADRRARLEEHLWGERFRFSAGDWRQRAGQIVLDNLRTSKSPAPFSLVDEAFNQDLLAGLAALDTLIEETPYRVFSVRLFNDSKRFETLKSALVRLARLGQPLWRTLPADEVLRELNLVANPTYLYLSGPWELVDADGQVLALEGFSPAVGLPAAQAAHIQRVAVRTAPVMCIENLTTFYEWIRVNRDRGSGPAGLCLAGNPAPALRRLLGLLVNSLPASAPLPVWADLDYGGFNILAQLRRQISSRFVPFHMDIDTLEANALYARPLTPGDRRNLARLLSRPELQDQAAVLQHLLQRGLKLEQEAIRIIPAWIDF